MSARKLWPLKGIIPWSWFWFIMWAIQWGAYTILYYHCK